MKFNKEQLKNKKITATLVATLGVLGLAGCGDDGFEYKECPSDWSYGQESLVNPSLAYEDLQASVAELRYRFIENAGINPERLAVGSGGDDLESVAPNVFTKVGNRWDMGWDTLVDAPGEAVCYSGDGDSRKYFFTPEAKAAIGSMKTVGIETEHNSNKGE